MKLRIWRLRLDEFDIIGRKNALVNYLAIRDRTRVAICTDSIRTGAYCFNVGRQYELKEDRRFKLQYEGLVFGRLLLFCLVDNGQSRMPNQRDIFGKLCGQYEDIYFVYALHHDAPGRLFWLTDGRKERSFLL